MVMYEAGFHGFWLHDLLTSDGIECIVTPPNKLTQAKDDRVKTDRRDARRLARNLESGDYVHCHVPDRERREDRQVSRVLNQIQKDIVRTKNRIRRMLEYHGLDRGLKAGVWQDRDYRDLSREQRVQGLSASLRKALKVLLAVLDFLCAQKEEILQELKRISEKERYLRSVASKRSCPGVGWLSAARFTLEWGGLERFPTGKCFAAYTGLTASEYSTGETIRRGRITGQSNPYVRSWLIECAWRAIKRDPVLLEKFTSVYRSSGSKKKAIVAVARKLAVRMRALDVNHDSYLIGIVE
jgi:transposase